MLCTQLCKRRSLKRKDHFMFSYNSASFPGLVNFLGLLSSNPSLKVQIYTLTASAIKFLSPFLFEGLDLINGFLLSNSSQLQFRRLETKLDLNTESLSLKTKETELENHELFLWAQSPPQRIHHLRLPAQESHHQQLLPPAMHSMALPIHGLNKWARLTTTITALCNLKRIRRWQ